MKKSTILAALLLTVSTNISATTRFYISENDSVRVNPNKLDGYTQMTFLADLDGYCDAWSLIMSYPHGLTPKLVSGITPLEGMTIHYTWRDGSTMEQECPLQVSAAYSTIASSTTGDGYWDNDGDGWFDNYGSIKWEPGTLEMFSMNYYVQPEFRSGWLTINGHITSGTDRRGAVLADYYFTTATWVWVGYQRGDVDGNDKIGMGDLTELIDYLVYGNNLDEFQLAAADVNASGHINMDDMTTLINWLVNA